MQKQVIFGVVDSDPARSLSLALGSEVKRLLKLNRVVTSIILNPLDAALISFESGVPFKESHNGSIGWQTSPAIRPGSFVFTSRLNSPRE